MLLSNFHVPYIPGGRGVGGRVGGTGELVMVGGSDVRVIVGPRFSK